MDIGYRSCGLISTTHRDAQRIANLPQSFITEAPNPIHQHCGRDTLNRVEVDHAAAYDRILTGLKNNLAS